MSHSDDTDALSNFIDLFEKDSKVKNEIEEELLELQKLNLATKAEYSNSLVIDRKKAQAAVKELLLVIGEQQEEIDILENVNKYYKEKLDEHKIHYRKNL